MQGFETVSHDRHAVAQLLSKLPLETVATVLAGAAAAEADRFLAALNSKVASLLRDEMERIGTPDPDGLALARTQVAEALGQRPARSNRWASPMGQALRRLWDLYGVEGPARDDDETALQQLGWALDRHRKRARGEVSLLFPERAAAEVVAAIREALDLGLADARDHALIARLPDLPVSRMLTMLREDHFSGQEFERHVESACTLDLSSLRTRALQPQ